MSVPAAGSDPREVGRLIALRYLQARPRTCAEVLEHLSGRGIPPGAARQVVERFCDVGLLDDRAYAQLWVESRARSRGLGVACLRQELRMHKVPADLIEEVLARLDPADARSAAVAQVRPRVARCPLPLSARDERRLLGFLQRRGHSPSESRAVLAEALAAIDGRVDAPGSGRTYPG